MDWTIVAFWICVALAVASFVVGEVFSWHFKRVIKRTESAMREEMGPRYDEVVQRVRSERLAKKRRAREDDDDDSDLNLPLAAILGAAYLAHVRSPEYDDDQGFDEDSTCDDDASEEGDCDGDYDGGWG